MTWRCFILNGPMPSRVRLRVGWHTRSLRLEPFEFRVVRYRPWWVVPARPALYRFEASVLGGDAHALVQFRAGSREIGLAYAQGGQWHRAIRFLEPAVAADPSDLELRRVLAVAYHEAGRVADARLVLEALLAETPEFVEGYLHLGDTGGPAQDWMRTFQRLTGLDPRLVTYALAQEFGAARFYRKAGRVAPDPHAAGRPALVFEKGEAHPGLVGHDPDVYLPRGAYLATFRVRAWDAAGARAFAVFKVLQRRVDLAVVEVTPEQVELDAGFTPVTVPFVHTNPHVPLSLIVDATGRASFAVEGVAIEPDLRALFRARAATLQEIIGR